MPLAKGDFAFTAHVPVRWSDMDALGHVNHARMVTLLEEARIQWLLSAGEKYAPLIKSAFIADVTIKFKAQLWHEDSPVAVGMYIAGNRSVDFTIGYEVRGANAGNQARPAIIATTQMAVVDIEARTLRRLTDVEKGYLASWSRG